VQYHRWQWARSTPRRATPERRRRRRAGAPARRTARVGGGGATILSAAAARRDRLRALLHPYTRSIFSLSANFRWKGTNMFSLRLRTLIIRNEIPVLIKRVNRNSTWSRWCTGAGMHRNSVPVNIVGPERRSGSYSATKAQRCCCIVPANICHKVKFCLF